MDESVTRRLRDIRRTQHRSLHDVSGKVGFDKGHLSRIERGLTDPRLSTVLRIADELGARLEVGERDVQQRDLVALLLRCLRELPPGSPLIAQSLDYLQRNGLWCGPAVPRDTLKVRGTHQGEHPIEYTAVPREDTPKAARGTE